MWDTKRQLIWLATGIAVGTFVVYHDAKDEYGRLDLFVFAFWEMILLAIIAALFHLYSRRQ